MLSAIHLRNITKSFSGVKALDGVSLTIRRGEILALVGENGAGKSTLMKVLSGVYPTGSHEGAVVLEDEKGETTAKFAGPSDAEKAGIAIIHQELAGFPSLSAAENLMVGHWPTGAPGVVNWRKLVNEARPWIEAVGSPCHPRDLLRDLSVGTQQLLEIAKALSRKTQVLILDEPTSALTPKETEKLFELLKRFRGEGKAIVYISHKLDEVFHLADRITVLRDGKSVHTAAKAELTEASLISHMVGRSLTDVYPPFPERPLTEPHLILKEYRARSMSKRGPSTRVFGPMDFTIRRGEIFGIAGLLGAGRTEFVKSLFGDPSLPSKGESRFGAKGLFRHDSPGGAIREGVNFLPEDRKQESLLPKRSIRENLSIGHLASKGLMRLIPFQEEAALVEANIHEMRVRCRSAEQEIQTLSGGNQQKVLLGRVLATKPELLMLDEPTRGVDVGAKYEIYEILFKLASHGTTLIVVSSELPELIGLCDRIGVFCQGKLGGILERKEFSQTRIMELAV